MAASTTIGAPRSANGGASRAWRRAWRPVSRDSQSSQVKSSQVKSITRRRPTALIEFRRNLITGDIHPLLIFQIDGTCVGQNMQQGGRVVQRGGREGGKGGGEGGYPNGDLYIHARKQVTCSEPSTVWGCCAIALRCTRCRRAARPARAGALEIRRVEGWRVEAQPGSRPTVTRNRWRRRSRINFLVDMHIGSEASRVGPSALGGGVHHGWQ
jgi:hypothetical protein